MGIRFSRWDKYKGSGGTGGSGGESASGTKSYHNGGVEGASFSKWYDQFLAQQYTDADSKGSGSGGTKGSGSGGTKGSGSGGTKGSGSGGTKGSGSGGTKGSGSGGTKGSGSGGTKGSGSGGTKGSGSGGTKGSGSGGTKGSGSGGTKGSGSGGTKGSGSGGTKGSGSGGTKGSGSGGTKGSGSGGTKGSGSGGTKGSGSGGTKGSGSGGTKGSGSGGTKGSGSGGTKGSGSGGTKGSGSGGTKGSGSGGTKGSGSGGTKGSGSGGTEGDGGDTPDTPPEDDGKTTLTFIMGDPPEAEVSVTETPGGQLFFSLHPTYTGDSPADIDGIFFNLSDDSKLGSLNFSPAENSGGSVTDIQAEADGVSALPNGANVGDKFDVGLQFGTEAGSSKGFVDNPNFTLWSDDGPVTFADIDLQGMHLVVDSDAGGGEVLSVNTELSPEDDSIDAAPDHEVQIDDLLALMNVPADEENVPSEPEEEEFVLEI